MGDLHAPWLGVPLPGVAAIPLPRCATGVMLLLPPRMLPSQPPRCRPRCASCSHVHVGLLWVRLRLAIPRHWTATHAHSSVSTASYHQPTTTRARSCAMDDRARAKDGRPVTDCWSRGQRPHAGTRWPILLPTASALQGFDGKCRFARRLARGQSGGRSTEGGHCQVSWLGSVRGRRRG